MPEEKKGARALRKLSGFLSGRELPAGSSGGDIFKDLITGSGRPTGDQRAGNLFRTAPQSNDAFARSLGGDIRSEVSAREQQRRDIQDFITQPITPDPFDIGGGIINGRR